MKGNVTKPTGHYYHLFHIIGVFGLISTSVPSFILSFFIAFLYLLAIRFFSFLSHLQRLPTAIWCGMDADVVCLPGIKPRGICFMQTGALPLNHRHTYRLKKRSCPLWRLERVSCCFRSLFKLNWFHDVQVCRLIEKWNCWGCGFH